MPLSLLRRPRPALFWAAVLLSAPALLGADRKFSTSNGLSQEAMVLVQLLEEAQYNRATVHPADYSGVIHDYMASLDAQHLFYLSSDEAAFTSRYGKNLYDNVRFLGNVDPAYEMFYIYQRRAEKRINWIFEQLKQPFDFSSNETYGTDRSKAEWPATEAVADELWHRRIKFELIQEMLNKKTQDEAKEIVRKRYVRALKSIGETEGTELAESYLDCITHLYDPHSDYMSAGTYEDFKIQMQLHLVGIGAILGSDEDYCVVRELVAGGPADLGGQLHPNDKIVAVADDGEEPVDVIGLKLTKIVNLIRGKKGTHVHLTVVPASATDTSVRKQVVITRDLVKLDSARAHGALFQVPASDGKTVPIGVITLPAFYGPGGDSGSTDAANSPLASQDIATIIGQLKQAGMKGLVLDLRHNGGGFLSEAVNVAGLFLPLGPVVQVKDSEGQDQIDQDSNPKVAYDGPMAVLVDRFSASASEIVTGALQNYGRAVVIGDKSTHGKGTVQTVLEMKSLNPLLAHSPEKTGAAKITIQKFYLPNGDSTQLRGVLSDIALPSIDDFLPGIGESDLPHAMVWDQIPGVPFDGHPLSRKLLGQLRQDSVNRQNQLEEFAFQRKDVDWYRARLDEKLISLNLADRRQQKVSDDAFKKQMDAERVRLTKSNYAYQEYRVAPAPPPRVKAPKKKDSDSANGDDEDEEFGSDDESYGRFDVDLREALRIVNDAIDLGQDHEYWVANHPPLTVAEDQQG
ncbi:MAG TPA: carboxy terminal-processing peptidase [Opitutaceae bacterium]|nr:carboxy terminal-processing peptidase [Opitutaceae bacterium]